MTVAAAQRVVAETVRLAQLALMERLVAAYAIGVLAHGGFTSTVSDVRVVLVLDDPLQAHDVETIREIRRAMNESGIALGDRLSLSWTSIEDVRASGTGRFPIMDLQDLLDRGVLAYGRDVRTQLATACQGRSAAMGR